MCKLLLLVCKTSDRQDCVQKGRATPKRWISEKPTIKRCWNLAFTVSSNMAIIVLAYGL